MEKSNSAASGLNVSLTALRSLAQPTTPDSRTREPSCVAAPPRMRNPEKLNRASPAAGPISTVGSSREGSKVRTNVCLRLPVRIEPSIPTLNRPTSRAAVSVTMLTPPSCSRRSSYGKVPNDDCSVSCRTTPQSMSSPDVKPRPNVQDRIGTAAWTIARRLRPVFWEPPDDSTPIASGAYVSPSVGRRNPLRSAGFRLDRLPPRSPRPVPPRAAARASSGGTGYPRPRAVVGICPTSAGATIRSSNPARPGARTTEGRTERGRCVLTGRLMGSGTGREVSPAVVPWAGAPARPRPSQIARTRDRVPPAESARRPSER